MVTPFRNNIKSEECAHPALEDKSKICLRLLLIKLGLIKISVEAMDK
jgi:hypothetical protein